MSVTPPLEYSLKANARYRLLQYTYEKGDELRVMSVDNQGSGFRQTVTEVSA
jgi:hypothetical protein